MMELEKCEAAKYSGWGKLQPSPLWRVKVTHRKRSILDVAFLKFKDISKQISLKRLCDFALVEVHQLRPFIHTSKPYWGGGDLDLICIKSHKHQGADPTEICVGISEVLAFQGLDSGQNVAIRGIKAWTGQSGHTADIIAAHSSLLASWHGGDAPITPTLQSPS